MPPRLPTQLFGAPLCLRPSPACVRPSNVPLIVKANASSEATKKRRRHDPYLVAQTKQRKEANLARQAELAIERQATIGDPVRGITTPFVEGFNAPNHLNHFLHKDELRTSIQNSYILTQPVLEDSRAAIDPQREQEQLNSHAENHKRAEEAISRIVNLTNGNQRDRTRANIIKCIETFGRHNTDGVLRPKAPSQQVGGSDEAPLKTPRAGPDTGSSEVQIAILTAKIKVLADDQAKFGHKDKVEKRNLRLLVHRRQKLMKYLRRKERGSDRWQNVVDTLGLTEGTWKHEISL